ncbi:MAG TPA: DUF2905 domain-containing protein [Candidatus Cloacimonetes bacterium]|nr:DUF2905 domain-containing protein [Candidatus Cloacimonadota bacterium]
MKEISTILIIFGVLIILIGLLMRYTSILSFLGKLPGDIRVEKSNFKFFFPITSMIIISIIINIIIRIFKK